MLRGATISRSHAPRPFEVKLEFLATEMREAPVVGPLSDSCVCRVREPITEWRLVTAVSRGLQQQIQNRPEDRGHQWHQVSPEAIRNQAGDLRALQADLPPTGDTLGSERSTRHLGLCAILPSIPTCTVRQNDYVIWAIHLLAHIFQLYVMQRILPGAVARGQRTSD